jgi:predicted nucleic acid-binding protein
VAAASFMPESSCMVAVLSQWHAEHSVATRALAERLARGEFMFLAAHSLAETYSVLTRLPSGRRLAPQRALQALEYGFISRATVVSLDGDEYVDFLRGLPARGVVSGQVYDALIAACAMKARVDVLVTLNPRHFLSFAGPGLAVVTPGA